MQVLQNSNSENGKHFEKCFGDISTRFIYYTSEEI